MNKNTSKILSKYKWNITILDISNQNIGGTLDLKKFKKLKKCLFMSKKN